MTPRIGVIAGTGMESLPNHIKFDKLLDLRSDTPWGSVPVRTIDVNESIIFLIDRHHNNTTGNRTPPHMINHRANIYAMHSMNVDVIVSVNSVGTMSADFPPGSVGVVEDILDLFSPPITFFDQNAVHTDRTLLFSSIYRERLLNSDIANLSIKKGIVSAQSSGPQFETPAEINALMTMGAHVVGMTLGPESRLVSEKGTPHLAICCASNWAAGQDPSDSRAMIDHQHVESQADSSIPVVARSIMAIVEFVKSK